MRQYLWEIEVRADSRGNPKELHYRNRWWQVSQLVDSFCFGGRWWLGEPARTYYLLELESLLDLEIYRSGETWVLARVQD